MPHPDADDLALLALGEDLGSAVDAHVAECAACTAEIEAFRETVGLAELSNFGEDAPRPGEHVWAAIAAELGFAGSDRTSGAVGTAVSETAVSDSDRPADRDPAGSRPPKANGAPGPNGGTGTNSEPGPDSSTGLHGTAAPQLRVVPGPFVGTAAGGGAGSTGAEPATDPPAPSAPGAASSRRWSRWAAPLAAAVVGIAVGAGAVIVSQNRSNEVTIEAVAPLTPVVGGPLTADQQEQLGKAELVVAPTGQEVRVNAADLPPSTNSYEVWLFGDDGRMVSLGTLSDGSGSFTVPAGINTREYRVVDVSDEPPDGNPAHSGISLIRGTFS